jgi:hypothetical protein
MNIKFKNYVSLDKVDPTPVERIATGHDELDWLYGGKGSSWGMPAGKISLWAGAPGTGKSRLAIEVAKRLCREEVVIYFQGETDLGDFASWIHKQDTTVDNFYVSESKDLEEQLEVIKDLHDNGLTPSVVFIDSVNMVEEYGNGHGSCAKRLIEGDEKENLSGYRDICKEFGCHIVLISQLNKKGEASGSTVLTHLVDQVFHIVPGERGDESEFIFEPGDKIRYAKKGESYWSTWKHLDTGVRCMSVNRLGDKRWLEGNNFPDVQKEVMSYAYAPPRDINKLNKMLVSNRDLISFKPMKKKSLGRTMFEGVIRFLSKSYP